MVLVSLFSKQRPDEWNTSRYQDSFDFQSEIHFGCGLISLDLTELFVGKQITCFNWTREHKNYGCTRSTAMYERAFE